MTMDITIALFLSCLVATWVLTPGVMQFARRIGAVDRGGYRKVSRREIPLLGGLAIALPILLLFGATSVVGFVVFLNWQYFYVYHRESFDFLYTLAGNRQDCLILTTGGLAILILGLIDDTKVLRARWKLLGQLLIACFVCLSGHTLTTVSIPFMGSVELGLVLGMALTVLWIVGVINAFNLIDGIDGLATGIALVGTVALVVLSLMQQAPIVTYVGAALAGSLLAFLRYNFPPARVFLGDTGSMFLGYSLAMLSLIGAQKGEAAVIVFAPILALSLPIFETFISMLRRYLRGVPMFMGDNHHTHHRLLGKGYSQPQVVLTLCGTAMLLAVAAILSVAIPNDSSWAWFPYALFVGTLVNIAWLAGYLRPTNLKAVLERRHRNKAFQALGRYVSLRLSAGMQPIETKLLLELCRHELGLQQVEIRLKNGASLLSSPDSLDSTDPAGVPEELELTAADGQKLLVSYRFLERPDILRRQDVSFCLAGIFDGMALDGDCRLDRNVKLLSLPHSDN